MVALAATVQMAARPQHQGKAPQEEQVGSVERLVRSLSWQDRSLSAVSPLMADWEVAVAEAVQEAKVSAWPAVQVEVRAPVPAVGLQERF
jgi:hypothetical protein